MKDISLASSGVRAELPGTSITFARKATAFVDRHAWAILALLLLVAIPVLSGTFRLGLFAKYLSFAFCAAGLVLTWGYGGILSLGQGIFFGLGSYMMAMYMKLEATTSDSSAQQLSEFFGSNLPDFMGWQSV